MRKIGWCSDFPNLQFSFFWLDCYFSWTQPARLLSVLQSFAVKQSYINWLTSVTHWDLFAFFSTNMRHFSVWVKTHQLVTVLIRNRLTFNRLHLRKLAVNCMNLTWPGILTMYWMCRLQRNYHIIKTIKTCSMRLHVAVCVCGSCFGPWYLLFSRQVELQSSVWRNVSELYTDF